MVIVSIFDTMHQFTKHIVIAFQQYQVVDTRDAYTCSFTEFLPFCRKLYCFSNFKDFNTFHRA